MPGRKGSTLTMGIDLASQPERPAVCLLAWDGDSPELLTLRRGTAANGTKFHDKWLANTARGLLGDYPGPITKVGIDAPFGWPDEFVDAVAGFRESGIWPSENRLFARAVQTARDGPICPGHLRQNPPLRINRMDRHVRDAVRLSSYISVSGKDLSLSREQVRDFVVRSIPIPRSALGRLAQRPTLGLASPTRERPIPRYGWPSWRRLWHS
jgi:hypothetical protein